VAGLRGNPAYLSSVARDALVDVQEAQRDGRLGFLVGAGLSTAIGLPGWNTFNIALVEQSFERHSPGGAQARRELTQAYLDLCSGQSLAAVDFMRRRVGNDFHVVLQGALYDRPELRGYAPTEVHHALCKLTLEGDPPFPVVYTTNYDDLLELALGRVAGRQAQAVHVGRRLLSDGPRVVHLHGYFPYEPAQSQRSKLARDVVLSDLDYSRLSNDHSAWTNRELLALLDARSVLIVGMSLTDPNVRRLFAYLSDRRREDGPQHYVVLLERAPEGSSTAAIEAARMLTEDEHDFWKGRGVKILRLGSWDRLNYLLRRIRFPDGLWDRRHREVRIAWAHARYGGIEIDGAGPQNLVTTALSQARDQLCSDVGLKGRVELNLFLPMLDGSYRRAFSSVPGRATIAPRAFMPSHDRVTIPEVENALILGQPIQRGPIDGSTVVAPLGQPAFQTWYRALVSVPTFDDEAGGVPVTIIQLCSSDAEMLGALDGTKLALLRALMAATVDEVMDLLAELRPGVLPALPEIKDVGTGPTGRGRKRPGSSAPKGSAP
jgi:hypothetical protein